MFIVIFIHCPCGSASVEFKSRKGKQKQTWQEDMHTDFTYFNWTTVHFDSLYWVVHPDLTEETCELP